MNRCYSGFTESLLDTSELPQPARHMGVRLTNLKYDVEQLSLFRDVQKKSDAIKAMDAVNI